MFASSCISETEQFCTSKYRVFIVIGRLFSITFDCLRDNHWSDDQQVYCLLLSCYNNICGYKKFVYIFESLSLIYRNMNICVDVQV